MLDNRELLREQAVRAYEAMLRESEVSGLVWDFPDPLFGLWVDAEQRWALAADKFLGKAGVADA